MTASAIHLWRALLDRGSAELRELGRLLSPDERDRAAAFGFERDRGRFIAGRALLRLLLSRYTSVAPDRLEIGYSRFGKPTLAPGRAIGTAPSFNLSHSDGICIYAVAEGRAVGVDLERVRSNLEVMSIASRFFSPSESAVLAALPAVEQARAFFECWTRKEAYVKAVGEGLSIPLDSFDVALDRDESPRLVADRRDPRAVERWTVRALEVGRAYAAAVAFDGGPGELRWRDDLPF